MNRAAVAAIGFLLFSSALACSSSGNSTGAGGTTGSAGTTGGGGSGGSGSFMAVAPCPAEASYTEGPTTITFGAATDISYMPKCLKVGTGATVTFTGDFSAHPLSPSALRGTTTGNPITNVSAGTTTTFTFPAAGYYAYFCTVHGPSDGAAGMVGVIWVQ